MVKIWCDVTGTKWLWYEVTKILVWFPFATWRHGPACRVVGEKKGN